MRRTGLIYVNFCWNSEEENETFGIISCWGIQINHQSCNRPPADSYNKFETAENILNKYNIQAKTG
jgi:hypothetical protein